MLLWLRSPFPQVSRWDIRKCTGDADAAPFVSIAFGGCQWCFYGMFAWLVTIPPICMGRMHSQWHQMLMVQPVSWKSFCITVIFAFVHHFSSQSPSWLSQSGALQTEQVVTQPYPLHTRVQACVLPSFLDGALCQGRSSPFIKPCQAWQRGTTLAVDSLTSPWNSFCIMIIYEVDLESLVHFQLVPTIPSETPRLLAVAKRCYHTMKFGPKEEILRCIRDDCFGGSMALLIQVAQHFSAEFGVT